MIRGGKWCRFWGIYEDRPLSLGSVGKNYSMCAITPVKPNNDPGESNFCPYLAAIKDTPSDVYLHAVNYS